MKIFFYVIIAILPSIIWLLFYLRKDRHPEPNRMVIKIFYWGILAALGALLCEYLYGASLKFLSLEKIAIIFIVGAAFIEEFLKYLVVKMKAIKNPECDEPIDLMLYMIIAALGFAAAENILLFLNAPFMDLATTGDVLKIALGRFLGAVFLHALASGIVGYFIARSLILKSDRKGFVGLGILIATCLHGIYNHIIIEIGLDNNIAIALLIIMFCLMAVVVSWMFKKLIKIKSFCKI